MHFEVLSLFPEYIQAPLEQSILKRAITKGLIQVTSSNIRNYSQDPHHRVDDRPYGGGPGMVLMPEPVVQAVVDKKTPNSKVIYLSPQGRRLTPRFAKELAQEKHLILLSGHYEGIDQRAIEKVVDYEVSIGDFVLTNGCLAALLVIDVVSRYIPGVLGDERASEYDSFESTLLDFPHYTRPEKYEDESVPQVLLGGNHHDIAEWREKKAIEATWEKRPDLFSEAIFFSSDCHTSDNSIQLSQISIPTPVFSHSCRFYQKLFGGEPIIDTQNGIEKATWYCTQKELYFTLYAVPHETHLIKNSFLFRMPREKCFELLRWVLKKTGLNSVVYIDQDISYASVQKYLTEKRYITLTDPSGNIVSLII